MSMFRCLPLLAAIVVAAPAMAGGLTPPGAPAPTMKTLDQVEPRIPIGQADVPLTISAPGSYYLTENLFPANLGDQFVIEIKASDVTLDLMGFRIQGATEVTTAGNCIRVEGSAENVAIRNGTITLAQQRGIEALLVEGVVVEAIRAVANGSDGIAVGSNSRLSDCVVRENGGAGITVVGNATVIENCTATLNAEEGINSGASNTVLNCAASENGEEGFFLGAGTTAQDCASFDNGTDGFFAVGAILNSCASYRNDGNGFRTNEEVAFFNCIAQMNVLNGFQFIDGSSLRDCAANQNGVDGFVTSGDNSRIEGCNAHNNGGDGFQIGGADNLVIRNSAAANAISFNIGGGNFVGPFVNAAGIGASNNPHSNYIH